MSCLYTASSSYYAFRQQEREVPWQHKSSTCPRDRAGLSLSQCVLQRSEGPKTWLFLRFWCFYVSYVNSDNAVSSLSAQTTRRYDHHFFFIGSKSILNLSYSLADRQLKSRKKNGAVFRRLVLVSGLNWPNYFA